MTHILVADDDIRTAQAIEDYLQCRRYRVSVCTSGFKALDLVAKDRPDLMILDVSMPVMDGIQVCKQVRLTASQTQIPILFLSGRKSTDDKIIGLEAGGDDYLGKPFDFRELDLRVKALLRRSGHTSPEDEAPELRAGDLRLDSKTFKAFVGKREVQLTPVEYELLRYLVQRAGEVVSAEQLLQDVWCYYPGTGDTAVVRVQIMNLRDKIEEDRKAPTYIRTVYRHGYLVPA